MLGKMGKNMPTYVPENLGFRKIEDTSPASCTSVVQTQQVQNIHNGRWSIDIGIKHSNSKHCIECFVCSSFTERLWKILGTLNSLPLQLWLSRLYLPWFCNCLSDETVLFALNHFCGICMRDCPACLSIACCLRPGATELLFFACLALPPFLSCELGCELGWEVMGQDFAEGLPHDLFDCHFGAAVRRVLFSSTGSKKQYILRWMKTCIMCVFV